MSVTINPDIGVICFSVTIETCNYMGSFQRMTKPREREREREGGRETEREGEREGDRETETESVGGGGRGMNMKP